SRQHKSHDVSCGRHPKTFTIGDIEAPAIAIPALVDPPGVRRHSMYLFEVKKPEKSKEHMALLQAARFRPIKPSAEGRRLSVSELSLCGWLMNTASACVRPAR